MKIQLLKRTVKLRIDRHIIVIPREKDKMHNYPHGFQGGLQSKTLCFVSARKYEIRLRKNKRKL